MSKVRRFKQVGSVVAFTIVGVVLTAALIGSIYFLRQHSEQVRKDQEIAAYDKQKAEQKTAEEAAYDSRNSSEPIVVGDTGEAQAAEELPLTGPTAFFGDLIAVMALTVGIAGYTSSRINRVRSL